MPTGWTPLPGPRIVRSAWVPAAWHIALTRCGCPELQGHAKKIARQIAAASLLEMLLANVPPEDFIARPPRMEAAMAPPLPSLASLTGAGRFASGPPPAADVASFQVSCASHDLPRWLMIVS